MALEVKDLENGDSEQYLVDPRALHQGIRAFKRALTVSNYDSPSTTKRESRKEREEKEEKEERVKRIFQFDCLLKSIIDVLH